MSTTDSREAFLEWKRDEGDIPNYIPDATIMASGYSDFELKAWQAALAWQAAKATGTAGELSDEEILKIQEKHVPKHGWSTNGLSFARDVLAAARQPAPVVAVKTWQERRIDFMKDGAFLHPEDAKDAEIADLRAALAARSQP